MYRIGQEEIAEVARVIEARDLFKINGGLQESKKVEEALTTITGAKYPIFMTSGHAALVSALVALGVGPGDQVIVPAYTYIATAMAVVEAGAIPVIAEVDETLTLSPADVERKITPHTRAIIPVHIQGFPCNMQAICEIAQRHGLFVVEDACQADGGSYKGKRLGTIGDAGAYSFNYFKVVTCGEGGALLTDNREVFERALIYQDSSAVAFFGNQMSDFTTEGFCGSEYRSNELCAAVLRVQLTRLDDILSDLRRNKKYMMEQLADVCRFAPSNDSEGDCGILIPIQFDTEEAARRFATAEGIYGTLPIDTDKHVYVNWTPILEQRGALHPLMDPFKMEANRDIIPPYSRDCCPETLDILSKVVYIGVDPDADKARLDTRVAQIKQALLQG